MGHHHKVTNITMSPTSLSPQDLLAERNFGEKFHFTKIYKSYETQIQVNIKLENFHDVLISLTNATESQRNNITEDSYSLRLSESDRSLNQSEPDHTYNLEVPTLQHTRIPYLFIGIANQQSILCSDEHVNVTSWTLRRPAEPIIDNEKSTEIFLRVVLKLILHCN